MKVLVKEIKWSLPKEIKEGTVRFEINGNQYHASSIHDDYQVGELADVGFTALEANQEWEECFGKNTGKRIRLIHRGGWSYDGYGIITSIKPVVADFGDIQLELGNWTNDERVVGEYIYWPIIELRIFRMPHNESL
jgi:hypothetical protein